MITSNDIIPELMNLMFGQGSQNVASNRICRHNMFFKYFSNTDASYMVPRIEVVDMLNSEKKIYYNKLVDIFKTKRDELFLSEFTYAIPYVKNIRRLISLNVSSFLWSYPISMGGICPTTA